MVSQHLDASASNDLSGTVSGYIVSAITENHSPGATCAGKTECYVESVQFSLTSKATKLSTAFKNPPSFLFVAVTAATGRKLDDAEGLGSAGNCRATTAWDSATGSGAFNCDLGAAAYPLVATVAALDIEANQ